MTDKVLQACRKLYVATARIDPDHWVTGVEGKYKRLQFIDDMCNYLRREDALGFADFVQKKLSKEPDMVPSVLEDLYATIGLDPDTAQWIDLEKQLGIA